jgi:hypothetical protein
MLLPTVMVALAMVAPPHQLPPLYTLGVNSTAWRRNLPPPPDGHHLKKEDGGGSVAAYTGDVRARLLLTDADIHSAQPVTAQIWWRRRDPRPENKSVIITDELGAIVASISHLVEAACGVISFVPTGAGKVYFA